MLKKDNWLLSSDYSHMLAKALSAQAKDYKAFIETCFSPIKLAFKKVNFSLDNKV